MFVNGKFRSLTTHEKDVLFDLAALFSSLNQRLFSPHLASLQFWIAIGLSILLSCPMALALPTGWQVVSGNVTVDQNGNTLNVTSNSNQAVVNYQSFNVANGETVNFNFLLPGSSILNRVLGGGPSTIAGTIAGNGQILLVNPAGITFTNTANLNVGGLIASSLSIRNSDYLAGQYVFSKDPASSPATVDNQGHIQADNYVALLGSSVKNDGTITAPQVAMAVGDQVHVAVNPDLSLQVSVDQALKDQIATYKTAITNGGTINAHQVELQAKVLEGKLYDSVVNNTGMIRATSATQDVSGNIVLNGEGGDGSAIVQNTGTLDASGSVANANGGNIHVEGDSAVNSGQILATGAPGGQGGSVSMLGTNVSNLSGSTINVSGDQGGGTALIGGDYQGQNAQVRNAQFNYMDAHAKILANAEIQGNGGKVILWSNDKTIFQGHIEAKGRAQGGNGGFVETSGHNILRATGTVDASAPNGKGGQWLLDPNNITIQNGGADTNVSCSGGSPNTCSTTDDNAIVTDATINTSLNAGTDVTIQTSTGGANTQAGDINVAAGTTISKTAGGDATLTLKAHNSILFNGTSGSHVNVSSSSGKLNVVLNSDTNQGADAGAGGAINLTYTDVTSNGGNITLGGGANPATTGALGTVANNDGIVLSGSTLTSGAGAISLRGRGRSIGGTANLWGVALDTGSQVSTTSGNITVNGTGGAGTTDNYGVYVNGSPAKITTQDGTVNINGTAGAGTGQQNAGVTLYNGGQITSTGTGLLNITGAGKGVARGFGVWVYTGNSTISSVNGDVTVAGTSTGTGISNDGVLLWPAGRIISTGTAKLNISGTASATGTSSNFGVVIDGGSVVNNSYITSATGDITITATGRGTTSTNAGLFLTNGGKISSTGTAKINITSTGSTTGTTLNYGTYINGTNSLITSLNGDVTLNATGGGNGTSTDNYGLYLFNGGQITSTGTATLGLTGIGGSGTTLNHGIKIDGNSAATTYITSANGNITLNGTAHGTTDDNYGLYLFNGGKISSTGSALLNITGQGSTTGTFQNYGINLYNANSIITSLNGDVTVTGTAGGTTSTNYGIQFFSGGQITSTGTAKLNVTGIGGNGTNDNRGITIGGNGGTTTYISSLNGDVTVTGTGHGTGTDNYGLNLGNGGRITSTGSAKLNITGTGSTTGTSRNYGVSLNGNNTFITSANGNITIGGTGHGSGTDNYGVYLNIGGKISSTGSALLNITGQGSTTGTTLNHGIFLNGASSLITSATGNVTLSGTGGGNGTNTDNYGLYLYNGGEITSTGAALLNLTGIGGSGTTLNQGIYINGNSGATTYITSLNGDITLTGTAHGTTTDNYGVYLLNGGKISSTGAALLNITGQGSTTGTQFNEGVRLEGANALITSVTGDVTVTGTGGGNGTDTLNHGLHLYNGQITSTGTAKLNITGTGGNGTNSNYGINIGGGGGSTTYITSIDGDVTLNGTGNGSGTDNYGLWLVNGGYIKSTGLAKLNISGTGGNGTNNNSGITIFNNGGANAYITSATGNITLNGTGRGSGTDNYGVSLKDGGQITSTGSALLNITGQGSTTGTQYNQGVRIEGTNALITSATGNVTLSGTGGGNGTSTDNCGLYLYNGGQITSTGNALLNLAGTGGSGTTLNHGIYLNGNGGTSTLITSATGNITLSGTGTGSGVSNYGLYLYNGGRITSTSTATLGLTGLGGNGTNTNYGVFLDGNNATNTFITSTTGNITISSTGQGSGTDNYGVYLLNGGKISSTGSALLNITGTGSTTGTNNNYGAFLSGANSLLTSLNGDVTLTALGKGSGTSNYGLYLYDGGQISSTGNALLNIIGTGSNGTTNNHGVYLNGNGGANTYITSATGDVTITGTGGNGSGNNNHGLYLFNGGQITSAGSADINLTGIKGANTSYGIKSDTGSNIIGSNTMTGDMTLIADTTSLANLQMRTAGELTVKPYTNSTSIGLNGGAGNLQMDTSFIDTSVVNPSKLVIGQATAGTGTVTIGNNWNFSADNLPNVEVYGANISTGSITAGTNSLLLRARTGNITINGGSILSSTANNTALVLAAEGNFLNNAGAGALSTPNGRWLVYAADPATSLEGGLAASRRYSQTFAGNPPSSILAAGNFFLYQSPDPGAPPPVVTSDGASTVSSPIPSLLNPVVYSSPLSALQNGSVVEQAPLVSPSYLFPQAKAESSTSDHLSLSLKSVTSSPNVTHPSIQASTPNIQLQEPQTELKPVSDNWILKLDTAQNMVLLSDPTTGQSIAQIPVGSKPVALVENLSQGQAYVANQGDKTISVIDISSHTVIQTISVDTPPVALKLSPDGKHLYVFGPNNQGPILINLSGLKVTPQNENNTQQIINKARKQQSQQLGTSINQLIESYFIKQELT
jgi:filamentous hemagglutinin family protein